eukprot:6105108-Prymnesium_polylepis.2
MVQARKKDRRRQQHDCTGPNFANLPGATITSQKPRPKSREEVEHGVGSMCDDDRALEDIAPETSTAADDRPPTPERRLEA